MPKEFGLFYIFNRLPYYISRGTVYSCPGHSSKTISLGALKIYVGFQFVTFELL